MTIQMTKKKWLYLLTIVVAIVFNTLYSEWGEMKAYVSDTTWTVTNIFLGIVVGLIRVLGVFFGLPTTVDAVEEQVEIEDSDK
jgi:ABC-type sulfate transport system permease component